MPESPSVAWAPTSPPRRADLIILGDPLRNLPDLVELSRATVRIIRQNIIGFAFGLNAVAVLLASLGILGPVAAAILHQVGSLLVLLNAMRLLAFGDWAELPPFRQIRGVAARIDRLGDDDRFRSALARDDPSSRGHPHCRTSHAGRTVRGQRGDGDRSGRGRAGSPVRRISGRDRARSAPPSADPARRGHSRAARPGAEHAPRVSQSGQPRGESLRWEASHGRSLDAGAEDEGDGDATLLTGDGQFLEVRRPSSTRWTRSGRRRSAVSCWGSPTPRRRSGWCRRRSCEGWSARRPLIGLLSTGRAEAEQAATAELASSRPAPRPWRRHPRDHLPGRPSSARGRRRLSRRLAAESDRQRRANEAGAYRAEKLAEAEGKAKAIVNAAEGRRDRQLALASSGADAFRYRLAAREPARSLTDFRLYWETISEAFAGRAKMILDASADRPQRLIMTRLPLEQGGR